MVTERGIKLLDFGVAKLLSGDGAGKTTGRMVLRDVSRNVELTDGAMIGTAAYMAPEQILGREIDSRTDVFAFGALLYEIVTGERAFRAESHAELVGAVLNQHPPGACSVRPELPLALERTIARCLAKHPSDRWQSMREVREALLRIVRGQPMPTTASELPIGPAPRPVRAKLFAAIGATVLVTALVTTLVVRRGRHDPAIVGPRSLQVSVPTLRAGLWFALSPDGAALVFTGDDGAGGEVLWVRSLASFSARPLPGTGGARGPFFSPDGRSVGFTSDGKLRRVDLVTGEVRTLCAAPGLFTGGAWDASDRILFGTSPGELFLVSASGGNAMPVLRNFEHGEQGGFFARPSWIDEDRFVYFETRAGRPEGIYVASVSGGNPRLVVSATAGGELDGDTLVFPRNRRLYAQRLDRSRASPLGSPQLLADEVSWAPAIWTAGFAVRRDLVAYRPEIDPMRVLTSVDRHGRRGHRIGSPIQLTDVQLTRDGTRALTARHGHSGAVDFVGIDLRDGTMSTLVEQPPHALVGSAVWSPDAQEIAFTVAGDVATLLRQRAAGGKPEPVFTWKRGFLDVDDWSPDGRALAIQTTAGGSPPIGGIIALGRGAEPVFLNAPGEGSGSLQFSPDGRWLAFVVSRDDGSHVVLTTMPPSDRFWSVSTQGGHQPRWRRDGHELYFLAPDGTLMAAAVAPGAGGDPVVGAPRPLFHSGIDRPVDWGWQYAVAADGRSFIVTLPSTADVNDTPLNLLFGWRTEPR